MMFFARKSLENTLTDNSVASVPSGVDGAVGVAARRWYVAVVGSRHEKAAAERLGAAGYEAYVAAQQELHQWRNGRRRKVDRVVIPSVVFIRCTERERREVVSLPYISRFMTDRTATRGDGLNRPVAVIPDAQMARLRFMLGQDEYPVEFTPAEFRAADSVRVIRGSLCGLTGTLLTDSDGTRRLLVSVPLLGGATITISPTDLEKI